MPAQVGVADFALKVTTDFQSIIVTERRYSEKLLHNGHCESFIVIHPLVPRPIKTSLYEALNRHIHLKNINTEYTNAVEIIKKTT